jgi:hypothetical protein
MKHTPEPWEWNTHGVQPATNFKQVRFDDYQRARRCVNACAGMDDPETVIGLMKSIPVGKDYGPDLSSLFKEMEKLKAQREELLEALEMAAAVMTACDAPKSPQRQVRELIAKMKGTNP